MIFNVDLYQGQSLIDVFKHWPMIFTVTFQVSNKLFMQYFNFVNCYYTWGKIIVKYTEESHNSEGWPICSVT